jgi:hypothetical protein
MWKLVVVALALLAAGCSFGTAETATTTTGAEAVTASTTVASEETTESSGATTSSTTTTTAPTTTRPSSATTTKAPATTTTITAPEGNEPPEIEIVSPAALSSHTAAYDVARKDFGANVALSSIASDPDGDAVTVTWSSSTQGFLGTGESIVAWLSTGKSDASQPVITATAKDQWGTANSVSVQIIVWIPSDT